MADLPPTPLGVLFDVAGLGRRAGLAHVYPGNAPELGGADTHCAACDRILIRRRRHRVVEDVLVDGACPGCGSRLAGIGLDRSRRSASA
jgi:pyruvate formate lyase activating enzyme